MDRNKRISAEGTGEEQETRERIMAAARQLMAQKGYRGATTRRIAELAGVNEVTIFRHFKNKEGLFIQVMEELTDTHTYLVNCLKEEIPDIREMLIHFGRQYYRVLVDRKELLMICVIEADNHPRLVDLFARVPVTAVLVLTEKLEQLHQQGRLRNTHFQMAAHMFSSTIYTAFMVRYRTGLKDYTFDEEQLFEQAAEILLQGILPE